MKRFWEKVDKSGDCWEWLAWRDKDGYGKFRVKDQKIGAHRVSWMIHNGEIPQGKCVCHTCDNPGCVNPDHLWVGTNIDNVRDREMKGRNNPAVGENHWNANLNENTVYQIRKLYAAGGCTQRWLAEVYGIAQQTVSEIVNYKKWRTMSWDC